MKDKIKFGKTVLTHFKRTILRYSDKRGFLKSWKKAFGRWWNGNLHGPGFKRTAQNLTVEVVWMAGIIVIGIPLAIIFPAYKIGKIFKNSIDSARHVHNCDGCNKCNHLQNGDDQ